MYRRQIHFFSRIPSAITRWFGAKMTTNVGQTGVPHEKSIGLYLEKSS